MVNQHKFVVILLYLWSTACLSQSTNDIPVLKTAPTRAHQVLGQFKQSECKIGPQDTPENLEAKIATFFREESKSGGGFGKVDAIVNFTCSARSSTFSYDQRSRKVVQCAEGLHCEGDAVRWK